MSEVHSDGFTHSVLHVTFESDFNVNIMNITFFVKWKFVNIHYCEHEMANVLCNLVAYGAKY